MVASVALADGPTLEKIDGKLAVPTRIAWLAPDGSVIESMEYNPTMRGCNYDLVFDCFEPQTDAQGNSMPISAPPWGFNTCGMEDGSNSEDGAGNRWYFGTTYCNPYVSNDMEFDPSCGGLYINRLEFGWYWHADGATGENCRVVIEHYEDWDGTCATGDPNGLGAWLGGVRMDFGYMFADPGHYWYSDVDLCGMDWVPLPADGAGSYNIWLFTYEDNDPNTNYLATCAQPMWWGTGDQEHPAADCIGRGRGNFCPAHGQPPDGQTSHQDETQWDDDYPGDGWHDLVECYSYAYGVCPDPAGALYCCYADCAGGGCEGDVDGDGDVDHSDLGELLAAYCSQPGDPNWNEDADFDGDGHVGHSDLGVLLANWGCGT
jgi:hypothetical protein